MKRGMIFVMLGTFFMMLSYMVGGDVYYYGAVASMVMLSLGAASLSAPLNRLAIDASEESTGKKTAIFSFGISAVAGVSSFLIGIISVGLPWFLLVNSVIAFLIFFSLPQDIFLKEDEENVPA
jgi:cellulose synthase/poly-beta-1,6-N-acetylglucosamine synthase-like glycosyltransferase